VLRSGCCGELLTAMRWREVCWGLIVL
jgi:hypothetical protein